MKLLHKNIGKKEEKTLKAQAEQEGQEDLFYSSRKTVKELIASNGINPNPLDYMVIDDNGQPIYTMCFYIDKMPNNAEFAVTFAKLFNFPNVTSNVFIEPLTAGKSTRQLDKRIVSLSVEQIGAQKAGDRNRYRKISGKIEDAERFAVQVESGNNTLFKVAFLFVLQSKELDTLRLMASDIHMKGREIGIELSACYGVHPEAFVSGYPTNRIFKLGKGIAGISPIKTHIFDKGALSTIFNHTRSSFSHRNGIIGGRNLYTGQPFLYDVYDSSHHGYGVIICGKTGVGKSATIKMYLSRYIDFDYRIRSIDFDSNGSVGEYGLMAEAVGGINYQIKPNSKNILNLFEIDEEDEFDKITGTHFRVLNLNAKLVDLENLIMIMVMDGEDIGDFSEKIFIKKIIVDVCKQLYHDLGIFDGDTESLYEIGTTITEGKIGSGRRKKQLPTMTSFYKKVLEEQKKNKNMFYTKAYEIICSSLSAYVKELNYCPKCLTYYSTDEIRAMEQQKEGFTCPSCNKEIVQIQGIRSYFDGQSTVHADVDTTHINIDISQLNNHERPIALLIVLSFMQENYIKKNSANPTEAKKMVALVDELHRSFNFEPARKFISDWYRTVRKRNVSPWSATQALSDYDGYEETKSIVKNSTTIMLFKQDYQDREFLLKNTPLTPSQVEAVLELGGELDDSETCSKDRKGEMCLIDNRKVVFLKVDYLTDSESRIVETDMNKIAEMYKGARSV